MFYIDNGDKPSNGPSESFSYGDYPPQGMQKLIIMINKEIDNTNIPTPRVIPYKSLFQYKI